jgi:phosphohistidine phosphatase
VETVARFLEIERIRPDVALCSPAVRTRETLEIVTAGHPGLGVRLGVRFEEDLYLASLGALVSSVAGVEPDAQVVLLVGHNPGLAELAAWLDPDTSPPIPMPPAALAVFERRVDAWRDLARGAAELQRVV